MTESTSPEGSGALASAARAYIVQELKALTELMEKHQDPVFSVLRFHLIAEGLLERVLLAKLPRGDRLIEKGGLTFAQKLTVVDALEVLPDQVIQSIRHLNTLRNHCSHVSGRFISLSDLDLVGRPLGKAYTKLRAKYAPSVDATLLALLTEIYQGVLTALALLELLGTQEPS